MSLTPAERKIAGSIGGLTSWANTTDRTARTEPGRRAFADSFLEKVDPEGKLPLAERQLRAEAARKAHFMRLALKSAQVRRRKRELAAEEAELTSQAADAGVDLDSLEEVS